MYRHIKDVDKYVHLYRDDNTGVAWVVDGRSGCVHSVHPNIHYTGSIRGMKRQGIWKHSDVVVKAWVYKYNISVLAYDKDDLYDVVAFNECQCRMCLKRKYNQMLAGNL